MSDEALGSLGITKEQFVKMCEGVPLDTIQQLTAEMIGILAKIMKVSIESKKAVNELAAATFRLHETRDIVLDVDRALKKYMEEGTAGKALIPLKNVKQMLEGAILREETYIAVHSGT